MQQNDSVKKEYYNEINIARGIGALIVLLGHAFPDAEIGVFAHPVFQWGYDVCYSFHMALFFWISGFVFGRNYFECGYKIISEVTKKVKRLLIPYLFLSYLSLLPKIVLNAYARNPVDASGVLKVLLGVSPNGSLWYIYTLFLFSVFALLIGKLLCISSESIKGICLILLGIFCYSLYVYGGDTALHVIYIDKICRYFIFYVMGIVTYRIYTKFKMLYCLSAAIVAIGLIGLMNCPFFSLKVEYAVTAVLGIYAILVIAERIAEKKEKKVYRCLDCCGNYSYDIYILSYYVQQLIRVVCFRWLGWDYTIVFVLELIIGFGASYLFAVFVLRKSRVLKCLLIGVWEE